MRPEAKSSPATHGPEIGYDAPAVVGAAASDIQTPCLIIDLDAFERNLAAMAQAAADMGVALRPHAKTHKSVDIAKRQMAAGAVGVCCQKVSEAACLARGGVSDVLLTNQVRDPAKIALLASLPLTGARIGCCVDDLTNVAELSAAAEAEGAELRVLVEIDCGAGRCGVPPGPQAVALAQAIDAAPGLTFGGLQAYDGGAQHVYDHAQRQARVAHVVDLARRTAESIRAAGLECPSITGAGTGSFWFEGGSGVYTELQCGSYAFMDADYQRVLEADGQPLSTFQNALFVLTSVMSTAQPGKAVCDAGLKSLAVDSGLPVIHDRPEVTYTGCSDEHGVIADPNGTLSANDRLRLIPGHCDPTCNLHDWYVGVRGNRVEAMWPVSARGKSF
jgi:3-hydroxy-D-aspartate aldolase